MRSQLVWLILGLALVPVALAAIGATPYVPGSPPDPSSVAATLRGSDLPLATIGYVILDAAWLIWAWLVFSLLLRVAVDLAEAAAAGAYWVHSLRLFSDAVT